MIQKIIHKLIRPLHPWRTVKFDELAKIYASMALRNLGFSMIGIFIPIFLYKSGVSLESIFIFYLFFFVTRVPVDFCSAFLVGRIGPKHAIGISTLIHIAFLFLLLTFDSYQWSLLLMSGVFSISNGLFFIAYHTDFSKVKDSKHGGKELGYLYIFERLGGVLGPLVGGILATFIDPRLTIGIAILILLASQIPLLMSGEPVRTHQHITFRGFPWKRFKFDYIALGAFNIDKMATLAAWPLLVSITVFADNTYASIGFLVAFSTALSILLARLFGRIVDRGDGLRLLRVSTWLNFLVHISRPFLLTPAGVIGLTAANEPVTLAYNMPIVKGFYDQTDTIEGYRIAYISFVEMVLAVFKAMYWLILIIFCQFYDPLAVLTWSFLAVGVISTGVLFQRFPALKRV